MCPASGDATGLNELPAPYRHVTDYYEYLLFKKFSFQNALHSLTEDILYNALIRNDNLMRKTQMVNT